MTPTQGLLCVFIGTAIACLLCFLVTHDGKPEVGRDMRDGR